MSKAEELANEYRNTMPAEVMKLWGADAAAELRRLAAENEALKADAERYRWIRFAALSEDQLSIFEALESANPDPKSDAEFDAAIDSAMKENLHG